MRFIDGCANMYFAMAVVMGVGLRGVREGLQLVAKDCGTNPSKLSGEEKEALGIVRKLPGSFEEAFEALGRDEVLREAVGRELVGNWIEVKKAEQVMLGEMEEGERRVWLMERY